MRTNPVDHHRTTHSRVNYHTTSVHTVPQRPFCLNSSSPSPLPALVYHPTFLKSAWKGHRINCGAGTLREVREFQSYEDCQINVANPRRSICSELFFLISSPAPLFLCPATSSIYLEFLLIIRTVLRRYTFTSCILSTSPNRTEINDKPFEQIIIIILWSFAFLAVTCSEKSGVQNDQSRRDEEPRWNEEGRRSILSTNCRQFRKWKQH